MKKLFFLFVLLFTCISFSQTNLKTFESLKEAQKKYFKLNRESIYLHLNKTKFVPQEGIWFAAYAYSSRDLLPHPLTTNLNVKLFNEEGDEVASKVIFTYEGIGEGFFDPNELELSPGNYQIKASTHFMRNFKEDLVFHETVEILGDDAKVEIDSSQKENYDLQLLPEGGHLLADAPNTVGVKLLDAYGKGVEFSEALLKNNKNEVLTKFSSNHLGLSKFSFTPVSGDDYSVMVSLKNGQEITTSLKSANSTGISLSVNNLHPTQVILSINTNEKTLASLQQKPYIVLVHQNGNMNGIEFFFSEHNTNVVLPIKKSSLNPGVNIITLFNDQQEPNLERLVYKEIDSKRLDASVYLKKNHIDSLEFQVRLDEKVKKGSLSISVLPSLTKSYTSTQNTASVFFLKPYVKGEIENASYYFDKTIPRKRLYDLDLLLLTQGWSKYEWRDIFNNPPKNFYASEVGFSVTGKINNYKPKKVDKIYMNSNQTNLFEILDLNAKGEFKLDSLFVQKADSLYIGSIKKRNGKLKKPQLFMSITPIQKKNKSIKLRNESRFYSEDNNFIYNFDHLINEETLDSITLRGDNLNTIKSRSSTFKDIKTIGEKDYLAYPLLLDYIAANHFNVRRSATSVSISSRRNSNLRGSLSTLVFLDNSEISNGFLDILNNIRTEEIESVVFNRSGVGEGSRGAGGVIEITTKKTFKLGKKEYNQKFQTYVAQDGFSFSKVFYTPRYASYNSEEFKHYGTIHWIPSLLFKDENSQSFKLINTLTQELTFFIEGLTEDGKVISEKIRIKP